MRRSLLKLVSLLVVALAFGAGSAPAASSRASLSKELSSWLAAATPDATFATIVTFHDGADTQRLDALGVGAVKLSSLPIAFATLTASQIQTLATWPEVRSLWHDQKNRPLLDESVPLVGADRVHGGEGLARAYTGAGVRVAVIDTGVDSTHPDLPAAKTRAFAVAGDPFEREPMVVAEGPTVDTYGHGTHVSSTIAGTGAASGGAFTGVAPGATIYSFKTDAGPFLFDSYILASFDWILSNPEEQIKVSSNSWGCCDGSDYDPNDPINVATKALHDAGVTVVFAASNSGGPDTLNPYSASPWVVSVAAGTKELTLADFSSRGRIGGNWDRAEARRTDTGVYRPTITAPGQDIEAAKSGQATVMAGGTSATNPLYTVASGTSMATPHVAGAVALMLEARPGLTPRHIIDILEGTATNMPAYELFEVGLGHLDAHAATVAAEKGKVHFPPSVNGSTPQFTLSSSTPLSGTVQPATWLVRECPDTSDGALSHHAFDVTAGTDAIYAEIEWEDPNQLVYLVLYDPECQEAGVSAALLDIGAVNQRALIATSPAVGTWTVAVYGRANLPTPYSGGFSTFDKN